MLLSFYSCVPIIFRVFHVNRRLLNLIQMTRMVQLWPYRSNKKFVAFPRQKLILKLPGRSSWFLIFDTVYLRLVMRILAVFVSAFTPAVFVLSIFFSVVGIPSLWKILSSAHPKVTWIPWYVHFPYATTKFGLIVGLRSWSVYHIVPNVPWCAMCYCSWVNLLILGDTIYRQLFFVVGSILSWFMLSVCQLYC